MNYKVKGYFFTNGIKYDIPEEMRAKSYEDMFQTFSTAKIENYLFTLIEVKE